MKNSRTIVIAAFLLVLGVFLEADRFAGAIHRGTGITTTSGTARAIAIRTPGFRRAARGVVPGPISNTSIDAAPAPPVLRFASEPFVSYAAHAARGSSAPHPFSARPPPAV